MCTFPYNYNWYNLYPSPVLWGLLGLPGHWIAGTSKRLLFQEALCSVLYISCLALSFPFGEFPLECPWNSPATVTWSLCEYVYAHMLSCVWLFSTPETVAHQAPLFMEFPGQAYWEIHFLLSAIYLTQGLNPPMTPVLTEGFFTNEPPGKLDLIFTQLF